jgi:hypothetical protein
MTEHVEIMNAPGNRLESRIDAALAFASELLELSPAFQSIAPGLKERVAQMQGQNRSYVAHEYFNRDWRPMHFGEIAENLAVIYDWANREIMMARLRRDPQMLQGVINALQPLAEAWREHAGLTNDLFEAANQPLSMAAAEVRSVGSAMAA